MISKQTAGDDIRPVLAATRELLVRPAAYPDVYSDFGLPWLYVSSNHLLMPEVDGIPCAERRQYLPGSTGQYQRRMFDVLPEHHCEMLNGPNADCYRWTDDGDEHDRDARSHCATDQDEWSELNPEPGARPVW